MNLDDKTEKAAAENQNTDQAMDKSRRSFAKGGLIAPFVMTLANRPAWGGARNLCTVSGFDSAKVNAGNFPASGTIAGDVICNTNISHGYWKNINNKQWPTNYWPVVTVSPDSFQTPKLNRIRATQSFTSRLSLESYLTGKTIYFETVFGSGTAPSGDGYQTLYDVLAMQGGVPDYRDAVAMLLNAAAGRSPIPESVISGLFSGLTVFEIPPNHLWTKAQLLDFINYYVNHG